MSVNPLIPSVEVQHREAGVWFTVMMPWEAGVALNSAAFLVRGY